MESVSKIRRYFNFNTIQACARVLLGAGVVYLAFQLINLIIPPKTIVLAKETGLKIPAGETKREQNYLPALNNRQLFRNTELTTETGFKQADTETIADLALMGILNGQNPQAVIQNKRTQKTYYLNQGQSLGQFMLKDIGEGKIILISNNQNYELYL